MKLYLKFLYACVFFAFSLLSVQASIRTVINADDGTSNSGSFGYELLALQNGDTLLFDESLATQTIEITSSSISYDGNKGKNITIIGNGVTISFSKSFSIGGATSAKRMESLKIEKMRFENFYNIVLSAPTTVRNCIFISTEGASKRAKLNVDDDKSGNCPISFEGCAFIAENNNTVNTLYLTFETNQAKNVSFVSCTFIRKYAGEDPFIKWTTSEAKTFTNCVFIDPNNTGTSYTISLPVEAVNFNGYNVIQGSVNNTWDGTSGIHQGTDIFLSKDNAAPLVRGEENGIYKVVVNGPAYCLLPANMNTSMDGITFPKYDLSSTEIEYTKATHSGAWQAVFGEEPAEGTTVYPSSVTISGLTDGQEVYFSAPDEVREYQLMATVLPNDEALDKSVTWSSSDETAIPIDVQGRIAIQCADIMEEKSVTFTATTVAKTQEDILLTATVTVTIKPYTYVTGIHIEAVGETILALVKSSIRLSNPTFEPANAVNKNFTWSVDDAEVATVQNVYGTWTLVSKKAGTVTLTATANENSELTASRTYIFHDPDYSGVQGAFLLKEGTYPACGEIAFINEETGFVDTDIYRTVNDGKEIGITTPFAVIYGDYFFFVSKQQHRLVIADKRTLVLHKSFHTIPGNATGTYDGRAFLGVDENTGYLGTDGGICVVKFDELLNASSDANKMVQNLPRTLIGGSESQAGDGVNPLDPTHYKGQVGTMLRVGDRVFAVQQDIGILVINANTHRLDTLLVGQYATLIQSKDGALWAGCTKFNTDGALPEENTQSNTNGALNIAMESVLVRIDPWTLETRVMQLPEGIEPPPATWGAWQADAFCSSAMENKIYWMNFPAWGGRYIYEYDIDNNAFSVAFDVNTLPAHSDLGAPLWHMYGCAFRISPLTGEMYVVATVWETQSVVRDAWQAGKINLTTRTWENLPNIKDAGVFNALWIFPDNEDPVVKTPFPTVMLNETHRYDTLALRPLVTDADNLDAAIIKTVTAVGDPTLVSALIRHDSLFITPLKNPTVAQATTVSLKFNSNGKVVTQDLSVTVEPGAIAHPVTGITLNRATAAIAVGQTLQLAATVNPADADNKAVKWTSNLPYIASVDDNGLVTAHLAPATVTITATTVEGGFKAVCDITVEPPAVNNPFALNCTDTTIAVGDSVQLSITESEQYTKLVWHSLNEAVATVSDSGMVTAVAPGTAKIMVEDPESDRFDVCMITVPVPYYIHLDHTVLIMNEGDMVTVKATISPPDSTVNWSTGDGTVADVTDKGLVIAGVPGNAIIVARLGNTQLYDTCKVTVRDIPFTVEVSEVGSDRATLKFPRVSSANCYPVYLYEGVSDSPVSVDTVKATAQSPNIFNFTQLKPDFFYEVAVAVISTVNGVDETVSTTARVQFNTKVSTSIGGIDATTAAAWYSGGALRLRNLKGYAGHVTSVTGQSLKVLRVNNDEETFAVSLSPGIYILTAQKEGDRKTFKFVVH
jgi:uncharacterized protein YjdB